MTGPRELMLCTETEQLLDGRNILVHSLITGHGQDHDQFVMAIYDPRRDTATIVTSEVVARHAEYFEQTRLRFLEAIKAETTNQS